MGKITIITPSYNRAYTLPACYESLQAQTSTDFLWLIVDDGSSDNTKDIVSKWVSGCNKFEIKYIEKPNGGKASALNMAFELLETEYAVVLDSDDTFYPTAIESALKELEACGKDDKCCGLMPLRHNPDGTVMGEKGELVSGSKVTMIDILNGEYYTELVCFYKSALLKKNKFPQFPGEKFVSPQWLDFELSRNYYFIASNSKICICEYVADGLTRNKRKVIKKNPKGYTAVKAQSFEFSDSLKRIVKHGIMYDCGCIISRDKKWLQNSPRKIWSILIMPFALLVYLIRFRNV